MCTAEYHMYSQMTPNKYSNKKTYADIPSPDYNIYKWTVFPQLVLTCHMYRM